MTKHDDRAEGHADVTESETLGTTGMGTPYDDKTGGHAYDRAEGDDDDRAGG